MGLNFGIGFIFTAKDLASRTMIRLENQTRRLGSTAQLSNEQMASGLLRVGAGALTAAAGIGTLHSAFSLAGVAGEFEFGLKKVQAITQDFSENTLAELERSALAAGQATQFTPQQATEGLRVLSQQGFNTRDAMLGMRGALDLAAGSQIEVEQATTATAAAIRVFGLEAGQANEIAGKLFRVTTLSGLAGEELSAALGSMARGANAANQSFETMLTSVALVRNTGVEASRAGNAVSSALLFAAKNGDKFAKIGVDITDSMGKFRDFPSIVLDTRDALADIADEGERAAMGQELFGRFGLDAFNAISKQLSTGVKIDGVLLRGREAAAAMTAELERSGGAAKKAADAILDSYKGRMLLLQGNIETLTVSIGKPFKEVLGPVVEFVRQRILDLTAVIQAMPAPIKKLLAVMFILASVATIVVGAFIAFKGAAMLLAGPLTAILGSAGGIVGILGSVGAAVVAALPVIAAIAAALGLVAIAHNEMNKAAEATEQQLTKGSVASEQRLMLLREQNSGTLQLTRAQVRLNQVWGEMLDLDTGAFFEGYNMGLESVNFGSNVLSSALGDLLNSISDILEALGFSTEGLDGFKQAGFTTGMVLKAIFDTVKAAIGGIIFVISRVAKMVAFLITDLKIMVQQALLAKDVVVNAFDADARRAAVQARSKNIDELTEKRDELRRGILAPVQDPGASTGGFSGSITVPENSTPQQIAEQVKDQALAAGFNDQQFNMLIRTISQRNQAPVTLVIDGEQHAVTVQENNASFGRRTFTAAGRE